ncbi:hypothetical protein LINGRAHAP2_LOCUS35340 [Linum grandiflorum]
MSVIEMSHHHHLDLQQGTQQLRLYHHRHCRGGGSDDLSSFSDAEDGDSTHSQFYSTAGGSYYSSEGEVFDSRRASSVSEGSVAVEIEDEAVEAVKVDYLVNNNNNNKSEEKDCRICHLGLESNSHESGIPIELGCSCKNDLAAAHKQCAETWFKIKGNKTCEICNSIARNVVGVTEAETILLVEHSTDSNNNNNSNNSSVTTVAAVASENHRNFWQGHRFLNFLLGCMVFAFVISWLFHFNVPSS